MPGELLNVSLTTCEMCGECIPVPQPRFKLIRLERGGRHQGSGEIVAHVCERCGKKTQRAWEKARSSEKAS